MNVMSQIIDSRKEEIERAVENIKLDTGLSYPENSLLEISTALGVEVVSADLPNFNGKKVKGYIKWNENGENSNNSKYVAKIYLNSNQSDVVRNFTLAHELGHFLLHKGNDSFRIDLQDYSKEGDPNNQETEANYFAGTLLMPKDKLFNVIRQAKNLEVIAGAFGVSLPAVESRLKWLNLDHMLIVAWLVRLSI